MASFVEKLRQSRGRSLRPMEIIDGRDQGNVDNYAVSVKVYDKSQNGDVSMVKDIPSTPLLRKVQSGEIRLDNNKWHSGINDDAALNVIGNTYWDDGNGTFYGMGWDGKPYSYKVKNKTVGDFTQLDDKEQRKAMYGATNGKVFVDDSITDDDTLAGIYRSVDRIRNYGNGNLATNVVIYDPYPEELGYPEQKEDGYGTRGATYYGERDVYTPSANSPYSTELLGTNYPGIQSDRSKAAVSSGWHPTGAFDSTVTHELGHSALMNIEDTPYRQTRAKYNGNDFYGEGSPAIGSQYYDAINAMFARAAKKTGYDNVDDAIASISEYATKNKHEAFAEAFADVMLNGPNANPFSAELVRLISNLSDEVANKYRRGSENDFSKINQTLGIMPEKYKNDPKAQLNNFMMNYRRFGT